MLAVWHGRLAPGPAPLDPGPGRPGRRPALACARRLLAAPAAAAMAKVALRSLIAQVGDVKRNLDFVELFAGDGAISTGLEGVGFTGLRIDARRRPEHNFMTPTGFAIALRAVLMLRVGGIFWAAPPCGTWVWVSRASTGRDARPEGSSWSARVQNALVERVCLLLRVCMHRKVFWALEQPSSSCMWDYPAMARLLQRPRPQLGVYGIVGEVRLQMGAFGPGFSRRGAIRGSPAGRVGSQGHARPARGLWERWHTKA
jgi:hypothetical protein